MARALALIDGNSFYCSCECVFAPELWARPVIVLSNNDGCAIARNPKAKALGIKMGDPFFQIRELCRREQVEVRSSNYTLYADMSRRMNSIYHRFTPEVERYSIDESWLDLTGFEHRGLSAYAGEVRATVQQWLGVPTCVGIGTTKTLSKLANHTAKKRPEFAGVCDLTDQATADRVMASTPVADLWGVGRASAAKLDRVGVTTVAQLRAMPQRHARQLLTVVGERIVMELHGVECLQLETTPPPQKGCGASRSFGQAVTTLEEMQKSVAKHATHIAARLRSFGLVGVAGFVYMHTNRFNGDPYSHTSARLPLPFPSNDTGELVSAATVAAARAFRFGFRYAKSGVELVELVAADKVQPDLFRLEHRQRRQRLMQALDAVNGRYGRDVLFPAAMGIPRARKWSTRADMKSPCYTTDVGSVPVARA